MKIVILFFSLSLMIFANNEKVNLNEKELKELKTNGFVIKRDRETKKGFISFDINKTLQAVYKEIKELSSYPAKIKDVDKVEIYHNKNNIIKAKIYIDNFFVSFSNSVIHYIDDTNHHISWTLDKKFDTNNYFAKMNGYWRLKQIDENTTRVFYANDLEFKNWVPGFLENYLFDKGLKESTFWLKQQ